MPGYSMKPKSKAKPKSMPKPKRGQRAATNKKQKKMKQFLTFSVIYVIIYYSILKYTLTCTLIHNKLSFMEKQLMTVSDKELEKYYEDMLALFRTTGWNSLKEDLESNAKGINSIESTKDDKDLFFRKGQLYVIGSLLNLEEQVRDAYDNLGAE